MSLAARVAQKPAFVPAPVDLEGAIARHVDRAFERLRRALLAAAPALVEPTSSDPDRSRARAMLLVETLEGFAIGSVVGEVASAARRAMPGSSDAIVRGLRSRETRSASRASTDVPRWLSLADAERKPLLECVVSRLHVRLCLAGTHARALLAAAIEGIPLSDVRTGANRDDGRVADVRTREEGSPRMAREIDGPNLCADRSRFAIADDTTMDLAFADQLELGWRFLSAVVEGAADPTIDDGPRWRRARALWPAWSRRVRGVQPIDCGYILRIH